MTYFKKLAALVLAGSAMLPSAGFAQRTQRPAPMTYAQFTLSPADLAEFQTSEYQACMARAGRDAYRATREVSCESDRKDLLEARLRSTMVSAQPAARGPRQQRYLDDQALRARTRNNACKAKFIGLGEYSVPFIRATAPCEAEETFRRIKWLERQR